MGSALGLTGRTTDVAVIDPLRTIPRAVLAITGLWVSLLLGASVLWPVGYGFDEPAHVSMAYSYSTDPFHYYAGGELHLTKAVVQFVGAYTPSIGTDTRLSMAPIPARSSRPTLGQLGGAVGAPGSAPNQMVQHPPAYYYVEAVLLRVPGVSGLSADLVIWLMRLVSVAMMAPVPLLCWDAARRLLSFVPGARGPTVPNAASERIALVAATVPLTIPNLIRDGAAVNNDTLLILATSFVLAMLARVVGGDRSLRTAAFVSVGVAVALWTKGFALMLPLIILLAYLCGRRRLPAGGETQVPLHRPLAVVAAGCLVGSIWWLRNEILYSQIQVNGFGAHYTQSVYGKPIGGGTLGPFIWPFLNGFIMRIWGEIGIPADQPYPGPIVVYGWALLAAAGIILALVIPAGRRARVAAWVFVLAIVALVAIDFDGSFGTWRTYHLVRSNQGRYIYSSVVSIAALATVGFARVLPAKVMRWAAPAVVVAAVATNAWCWLLILRSDYQPAGRVSFFTGLDDAVHGVLRWAPIPSAVTIVVVFALPVAASVLALGASIRDGRRPGGDERSPLPEPPTEVASVSR